MMKRYSKSCLLSCGLFAITVMLGIVLSSSVVKANSSGVDKFNLTIRSSCTIESTNNVHTATVDNNQKYDNLGGNPTTFTVYCNDKDGYIIYAIGSGNNNEGNTDLVGNTGHNIPTGIYRQGDTTSSWAFRIAALDNTLVANPSYAVGDGNFATVPNAWDWVAKKENGTTDESGGSKISATYSVYVSGTQPAGIYTGQVKYALFHPSNTTTPVTLAQSFEAAGKSKIPVVDPITGETGNFYAMQDMNSSICDAANVYDEASQMQLVDTRDGKLYWVTKLSDDGVTDRSGQCWMTENLDLDLEITPTNVAALTSENTNLTLYGSKNYDNNNGYSCSNNSPTCEGGVITWTPERSTIPQNELNSWRDDTITPYSYDRGVIQVDGQQNGHGYVGNYYNWSAAIASNNNRLNITSENAANSVCPKGWRLPKTAPKTSLAPGEYEFSKVFYAYNVTKDADNTAGYVSGGYGRLSGAPLYYIRAGAVYVLNGNPGLYGLNSSGYYWSSTKESGGSSFARDLMFTQSSVYPASGTAQGLGAPVRCLAE